MSCHADLRGIAGGEVEGGGNCSHECWLFTTIRFITTEVISVLVLPPFFAFRFPTAILEAIVLAVSALSSGSSFRCADWAIVIL